MIDSVPVGHEQGRLAPLDGIRAFAVTAVILYHATPGWTRGGYFGVDVFFVLSGYLITSLVLGEWQNTGRIATSAFWARRARRLLPALFLMLAVVSLVADGLPRVLGSPGLFGDTIATLTYVANWHLAAAHVNYFAAAANPSPLVPTWSLAIEEQFYLIWPLVLLVLLGLVGGTRLRRRPPEAAGAGRRRLFTVMVVAAVAAAASALVMAVLTSAGAASADRAYFGSDTRAQSILVGAALAAACLWWGPIRTARGRRLLSIVGVGGAVLVVAMWRLVTETSGLTFRGGFVLLGLGTAAVIACIVHLPDHRLSKVLSARPLPYFGRISYGMYLWYWPVLLVMTSDRTHLQGLPLLAVRLAAIVAIAAASFHLVESPIRRGALAGWRSWVMVPTTAVTISLLAFLVPTLEVAAPAAQPGIAARRPPVHPVRILLVGDSIMGSLGVGLSTVASRYDAQIVNRGYPGCSLSVASQVRVLWYTLPPGAPCEAAHPDHLLVDYHALVQQFDPDVVVYLARSDTLDIELNGTWQHLGQPTFDRWTESRLQQAVATLSSGGARVVMLTTPYYRSGERSDGQPLPENDPARVAIDNRLLREVASHSPDTTVIDVGTLLSPSGHFTSNVDGIPVRCADGIHLTVAGGQWVGARLLPQLASLGRPHAAAATRLLRPALPPQLPPAWYAKLPCGV